MSVKYLGARQPVLEADRVLARIAASRGWDAAPDVTGIPVELQAGELDPRELNDGALAYIVISGLIARTVNVPTAASIELISPGDVIQPGTVEPPSFATTSWAALEPSRLLKLDDETAAGLCRHPDLLAEVLRSGVRRAHTLTVNAAIESIVGVENRLLMAMWHLAEHYGTVTSEGVEMPLRLTHELLAVLVGSRRPSVTAALSSLVEQGLIARRSDRTWVLKGLPPEP